MKKISHFSNRSFCINRRADRKYEDKESRVTRRSLGRDGTGPDLRSWLNVTYGRGRRPSGRSWGILLSIQKMFVPVPALTRSLTRVEFLVGRRISTGNCSPLSLLERGKFCTEHGIISYRKLIFTNLRDFRFMDFIRANTDSREYVHILIFKFST